MQRLQKDLQLCLNFSLITRVLVDPWFVIIKIINSRNNISYQGFYSSPPHYVWISTLQNYNSCIGRPFVLKSIIYGITFWSRRFDSHTFHYAWISILQNHFFCIGRCNFLPQKFRSSKFDLYTRINYKKKGMFRFFREEWRRGWCRGKIYSNKIRNSLIFFFFFWVGSDVIERMIEKSVKSFWIKRNDFFF